ncbi:MAG: HU family DNA-binding protein [Gammaproteobacteria bacterium]|nr:HU family DNA-binding protein [Gammaproteobacteria bacterium]
MVSSKQDVPTLNRGTLASLLHQEFGISERDASGIVNTYFEEICASLEMGNSVQIKNFGVFSLVSKNIQAQTHETSEKREASDKKSPETSAAKRVKFVPSKKLLDRIAKYAGPGIEG